MAQQFYRVYLQHIYISYSFRGQGTALVMKQAASETLEAFCLSSQESAGVQGWR